MPADSLTKHTVGRRKEAVCRLYLTPGSGKWNVNGRTLGDYFPRPALVSAIQQPFTATDTLGRYDVRAKVGVAGSLVRPARSASPPLARWFRLTRGIAGNFVTSAS